MHFGFRKEELPYIYSLGKYSVESVKCLIAHFILNQIENSLKKGYTYEMVKNVVKVLIEDYREECKLAKKQCKDYCLRA